MVAWCTIIFVLGLVTGSFLNVCIYRIPLKESVVWPRSHCSKCGTVLEPLDLIPVFSYVFLKGRCRYCGERISYRYTLVELLTAVVFLLIFLKYSVSVEFVAFSYLMAILIVVFFVDLEHRIIPDGLVVAALAGGIGLLVYNAFVPVDFYGDSRWWSPLLGIIPGSGFLLLVAVIGIIVYRSEDVMGMGDVKIFAPIGIFLGWKMCLVALLISVLAGGIAGVFLMVTGAKKKRDTIPFGPFIVAGAFTAVMWGQDILNWYLARSGL